MDTCYFCKSISSGSGLNFIPELESDTFVASWDANPITPGHLLVIPKRHAQYMEDLNDKERKSLLEMVLAAKRHIRQIDLIGVYENIAQEMAGSKSEEFINLALAKLKETARAPEAFNDGLNDGPAAGQTVPHFHWHVLPRWQGDVADPRGGIRHMFPGVGNYHLGVSKQ